MWPSSCYAQSKEQAARAPAVVAKPVAAKPVVTKPVAAKPVAAKLVAAKPPAATFGSLDSSDVGGFTFGNFSEDDFDPVKKNLVMKKTERIQEVEEATQIELEDDSMKNKKKKKKKKTETKSQDVETTKRLERMKRMRSGKTGKNEIRSATSGKSEISDMGLTRHHPSKAAAKNATDKAVPTSDAPPKARSSQQQQQQQQQKSPLSEEKTEQKERTVLCTREWLMSMLPEEFKTKEEDLSITSCHPASFLNVMDKLFVQLQDRPPGM